MRRASIQRRLLAGVAAVQVLAVALGTLLAVQHEWRRSYAQLEARLVERAAMVKSVIETPEDPAASVIVHRELLTLPREDVYVLSDARGNVIAASGALRPLASLPSKPLSFETVSLNGRRYRVLIERSVSIFDNGPKAAARSPRLMLLYGSPISEVEWHVHQLAWEAIGLGMAILTASLLAVSWVVRTGLRPMTQLAERASKIDALHWEWQTEDDGAETEELVPLSLTLSRLVERLRAAFVRERQFSADAAHEMKTAVAIVKSTLQLALERGDGGAEYRSGIRRALDDTGRMQELVSGMLQLAKIEGLAEPSPGEGTPVNAADAVHAVLQRLEELLLARRIRVSLDADDSALCVRITPEELNLVLLNLLENAVHYSPDGSAIAVSAKARGESCVIAIRDAGCGIAAAALPHIFERFYRGDASRSRESGGVGLGLAIVQAIVHRAGGTVTAESSPGSGSVFTVTLPRWNDRPAS